ncbi:hypothetical protein [Lutimonas sp.]|uniref:hypothetical protein n=1 Tax=Lutimonas sp. TaxID=1872403 RepID=UPI003D9B7D28
MKWATFIVFLCILNSSPIQAQNTEYQCAEQYFSHHKMLGYMSVVLPHFINYDSLNKSRFNINYKTIVDLVAIGLLIISTIFVVVTPLILLFFWVYFSLIYVREYRHIFSIRKWLSNKGLLKNEHYQKELWPRYRKVYSNMLGFGISIIAYSLFAINFMSSNFDRMEIALVEYLSYPFKVLGNLKTITLDSDSVQAIDIGFLWDEMFIIVILSFVFYLVGWLTGSLLVDYRFRLLTKNKPGISKNPEAKKEMFYLKLKKELEKNNQLNTEQIN